MGEGKKIIVKGRLGKDPELKYTKERKAICCFSLATQENKESETIWHQVIVYDKQAETCSVQLKKGSLVFIEGIHAVSTYKGRDGLQKTGNDLAATLIGFP